jgi:DNA-binding transcriptional ArsR family regulator
MNTIHRQKAEILKALGHPIRYCIVEGLLSAEGEQNVADLVDCLRVPQPTVSQHLQILRAAGILEGRRAGNEMHYSVVNSEAKKIVAALK